MKQLSHESILKLYEIWENQHSFFYVIEYSNVGSLKDRIGYALKDIKKNKKSEILIEDEIKLFMHQLLKGLAYLKEKKVMHRDIKPDNILIRKVIQINNMQSTSQL